MTPIELPGLCQAIAPNGTVQTCGPISGEASRATEQGPATWLLGRVPDGEAFAIVKVRGIAVPLEEPVDLFAAGLNGAGGWVANGGDFPRQVWDLPTRGFADPDARFEYVSYAGLPSIRFVYDKGNVQEHVVIAHSKEGMLWVSVKALSGSELAPSILEYLEPTIHLRPTRATNRLATHFPQTTCVPRLTGELGNIIGDSRRQYSYAAPDGEPRIISPTTHSYSGGDGQDSWTILIETDSAGLGSDALSAADSWYDEMLEVFADLIPMADRSYRRTEAQDCPAFEVSGTMNNLPTTVRLVLDGSATIQVLCAGAGDTTACDDALASLRRLP